MSKAPIPRDHVPRPPRHWYSGVLAPWNTTLALLVLIATGGLLSAAGLGARLARPDCGREWAARAELSTIVTALDTFAVDNNHYPTAAEGLAVLVPARLEKLPFDPWQHPYLYAPPSNVPPYHYTLRSAGPGGIPNTSDDIICR